MSHIPLEEIFKNKLKRKIKSKIRNDWKRDIFFNHCPGVITTGSPSLYFFSNVSPGALATGSPFAYSKKVKKKPKFASKKILKELKILNKNILLISLNFS